MKSKNSTNISIPKIGADKKVPPIIALHWAGGSGMGYGKERKKYMDKNKHLTMPTLIYVFLKTDKPFEFILL